MYKVIIFDFFGVIYDDNNSTLNFELIELIQKLKSKYKIGLLSNTTKGYLRSVPGFDDIEQMFDEIILSSEVGFSKPDVRIFDYALKKFDVKTSEVIFVDDSFVNVQGASSLGIEGVHFSYTVKFIERLSRLLDKQSQSQ